MTQHEKRINAFILSLIAGILILCNSTLLGVATTWFPEVIPTLPEQPSNDTTTLYYLTAIGLIFGILVVLGTALLHYKPAHKKMWGILIVLFSISSVLTGGGFIIGFLLGIIGGAKAFSQKTNG